VTNLVLLNGPPASGKSTLAVEFVARRPLALKLDIDIVRGLLGGWKHDWLAAGDQARRLAIAMAETHLGDGHDVIIPQFLARPNFIDELADTARRSGVRFVEVALIVSRADALSAFDLRSATSTSSGHQDAHEMIERLGGSSALGAMFDEYASLVNQRPSVRRVDVVLGDIAETMRRLERVVESD